MENMECIEFKLGFCIAEKFYTEHLTVPCPYIHKKGHVSAKERKKVFDRWRKIIDENNSRVFYFHDIIKRFYVEKYSIRFIVSLTEIYDSINSFYIQSMEDVCALKRLLKMGGKLIERMPYRDLVCTSKNLITVCKKCAYIYLQNGKCTHKFHGTYSALRKIFFEEVSRMEN